MLIYRLAILAYGAAIHLAALFSAKARQWVAGRRNWHVRQAQQKALLGIDSPPVLWMHCASLGEFEQGRPLLEKVRKAYPQYQILLTFYSPSGYEVRKHYQGADAICYLPLDTPRNARRFVALWQPQIAIFVKYEFWYYHFRALSEAGIPIIMIAAIFRPGQAFFRWYGRPFLRMLKWTKHLFLQNESSARQLSAKGLTHYTVCGDPRVDRVAEIAANAPKFPLVERFVNQQPVLVIGSAWPEDDEVLLPLLNQHFPKGWKIIYAPHHISDRQIENFRKSFQGSAIRYSQAEEQDVGHPQMLIIDNIGMLSALYQYGKIAYIGGAFGDGLHNTLEPIAFGLPVLFGSGYHKFEEATYLVESGGGVAVNNADELIQAFQQWQEEPAYQQASASASAYISNNRGASEKILNQLFQNSYLSKPA
jgi:3-deoxy-D-manno-octulosonic-acid transferase